MGWRGGLAMNELVIEMNGIREISESSEITRISGISAINRIIE